MWDKLRLQWAWAEHPMDKRRRCIGKKMDERDFVNFALMNVKHSVIHRPKTGDCLKETKERKEPRKLVFPTTPLNYAVAWLKHGPLGTPRWEMNTERNPENLAFCGRGASRSVGKIDSTSSENTTKKRTTWRIWKRRESRRSRPKA